MSTTPLFQTVRVTKSTRTRAENFLKALDLFIERTNLENTDLELLFGFSSSGTRKYVNDFVRFGLIRMTTAGSPVNGGRAVYTITSDEKLIEQFQSELRAHLAKQNSNGPTTKLEDTFSAQFRKKLNNIQDRFPDRQIHLTSDDMAIGVRMMKNAGEGKRDALTAALFGPPKNPGLIVDLPKPKVLEVA